MLIDEEESSFAPLQESSERAFTPAYFGVIRGKEGRKEGRKEGGKKKGRKEGKKERKERKKERKERKKGRKRALTFEKWSIARTASHVRARKKSKI